MLVKKVQTLLYEVCFITETKTDGYTFSYFSFRRIPKSSRYTIYSYFYKTTTNLYIVAILGVWNLTFCDLLAIYDYNTRMFVVVW